MNERPSVLAGPTVRVRMGCGKVYLTINSKFGDPFEIFMRLGKAGGCQGALLQALSRVTSIALQYGAPASKIAKTLSKISCPEMPPGEVGTQPSSCVDALAELLEDVGELNFPTPPRLPGGGEERGKAGSESARREGGK